MNKKTLTRLGITALVVVLAYFGNVEVQTYLGKKALTETGLEVLSLDQALVTAKAESKPILADLSAIWCPSCRTLDRKVLADPEVRRAIQQNFVFARIEYESKEGQAFQQRYGVRGFPNLLILSPDGEKLRQLPVVFDPVAFRQSLAL